MNILDIYKEFSKLPKYVNHAIRGSNIRATNYIHEDRRRFFPAMSTTCACDGNTAYQSVCSHDPSSAKIYAISDSDPRVTSDPQHPAIRFLRPGDYFLSWGSISPLFITIPRSGYYDTSNSSCVCLVPVERDFLYQNGTYWEDHPQIQARPIVSVAGRVTTSSLSLKGPMCGRHVLIWLGLDEALDFYGFSANFIFRIWSTIFPKLIQLDAILHDRFNTKGAGLPYPLPSPESTPTSLLTRLKEGFESAQKGYISEQYICSQHKETRLQSQITVMPISYLNRDSHFTNGCDPNLWFTYPSFTAPNASIEMVGYAAYKLTESPQYDQSLICVVRSTTIAESDDDKKRKLKMGGQGFTQPCKDFYIAVTDIEPVPGINHALWYLSQHMTENVRVNFNNEDPNITFKNYIRQLLRDQ